MMPNQLNQSRYPDHPRYANLLEQLDGWHVDLLNLLQECKAAAVRHNIVWHRLLEVCQGDPVGLELKSSNEQYALILPDASEPGRYRAQMFDAKGFFGHSTRDTPLQVLEGLIVDGYTELAPGSMERLSQSVHWQLGTLQANLIAEVNQGTLTYQAMLKRLAKWQAENEVKEID